MGGPPGTGCLPARLATLTIGTLTRDELAAALADAGVHLNDTARVLLAGTDHDDPRPRTIRPVALALTDLGLPAGATLTGIHAAARAHGLTPCPPDTAPYLRLAHLDQATAPDTHLTTGNTPTGSLTVLTTADLHRSHPGDLTDTSEPTGAYLRVIAGTPWLRGYRCGAEYVHPPEAVVVLTHP